MNRYDGKVEMELQGDRDSISRMLAQIDAGTFIHMDDIEVKDMPVDESERAFVVRHQ
jgi:acylphosphatase